MERAMPFPAVAARLDTAGRHGYRADIDGLRAVAVVPVVLFHAGIAHFSGGYVGVDVFFVISGYLITRLIAGEIQRGAFSLARFYERRIRRIFPALFAMLGASLIAGLILFLPRDFENFGRNLVGVAGFVSNIFFWAQTDYFDGPAELKPLLHTWSLAVEEQFYIVFPLFLAWMARRRPDGGRKIITIIALASLAGSAVAVAIEPTTAFYLTPFRAWELLLGSLLALEVFPPFTNARQRQIAAFGGLALILASVTLYSDLTPFPGLAALLPCVGAALIIHAGEGGGSLVGRFLSLRPIVFIGLISYSVYLWHWPLIVFASYYLVEEPTVAQTLALIAASFALGGLSWRTIELPFRKRSRASPVPLFAAAGSFVGCALLLGTNVYAARGWPQRFPERVDTLSDYAASFNPLIDRCAELDAQILPNSPCTIGDPAKARLFLWGDSHAAALFGALAAIAREGVGTVYGATPRCPPLLGVGTDDECIEANQGRLDYVLGHPEIRTVILAARWSFYVDGRATAIGPAETNGNLPELEDVSGTDYPQFSPAARREFREGLTALVDALLLHGKRVVLIYPIPEIGYDVPSTLARIAQQGGDPAKFTVPARYYYKRQNYAFQVLDRLGARPNLARVYPNRILCPGRRCLTYAKGVPLYFDSHHLSIPGSRMLAPDLAAAIGLGRASAEGVGRIGRAARSR